MIPVDPNPKQKVGLVIIGTTVCLVAAKGSAWHITGSIAVQSEAFNSAVDLVYSAIIITGFLLSQRERTSAYPEGLVRLEPLVSLVVSGAIVTTGVWIGYTAITQIVHGVTVTTTPSVAVVVLMLTGVTKYGLYRYISRQASRYDSPSLAATAVDTRNDVLTASVAIIGVIGSWGGVHLLEPVAAMLIASYITYSGLRVAEENFKYALGRSVPKETEQAIETAALGHDDVYGLHDVEVHYTGPLIDVSLHAEIEGDISIEDGHRIEISIADAIRDAVASPVNEINIHLDPHTLDEWGDDSTPAEASVE